ncbi:MAG TPA: hypothetical protein VFG50_10885 [Rhodothermales bacterium]|nr:hypothetical protein [Rhodothermales bacterium]
MSNGINPYYQNRFNVASPVQPRSNVRAGAAAQAPEQTASSRPAEKTSHPQLSQDEQQMIDRYFPASESMSMRLYGPGQASRTLNASKLGGRLDVQG